MIAERRLRSICDLAAEPTDGWAAVLDCVAKAPEDLPFAALYQRDGREARLVDTTSDGVPERWADDDLVASANAPLVELPAGRALPIPIPGGLFLAGVSPSLAFDDDYRRFLVHLSRQVAAALAVSLSERQRREREEHFDLVIHELRNPMSPILLTVQLLQRQSQGQFDRELGLIDRQTRQLDRMVDDLVDANRVARGTLDLTRSPVPLLGLLERVATVLAGQLADRTQTLAVAVDAELTVMADEARLVRVLTSVLATVSRHGNAGSVVTVRGQADRDQCVVSVEGLGTRLGHHLEISIALLHSVIEAHGGVVKVEAQPDGARVVIRLPGVAAPMAAPTPKRVLVVDDNMDSADVMAMALRARGWDTRTAYDPAEALSVWETFGPAAALLDIGLPGMDGYELATRVRALADGDRVKLLALTGYSADATERRGPFDEYFVKPVDVATIDGALKRLLG